jgi:hypothetical protein
MSVHKAGFRSREEMQRDAEITGRYRQIGIKAVASASIVGKRRDAAPQMNGQTQSRPQIGASSTPKSQQQR